MEQNKNQHTALMVMDLQGAMVGRLKDSEALLQAVTNAVQSARDRSIPVIYVVVGFRKGYPEVSPNNKSFSVIKSGAMNLDTEAALRIHAAVAPLPDDIIVTKRRVSAFAGSDLEIVLRAMGIKHLVLTGIATGGVVLSTLREAADKDYQLTVLSDGCADADDEVHHILTTKVFVRQAAVVTSREWCAAHTAE